MANEATIIELFNGGRPIKYNCAKNTDIVKGTVLELVDPRTVKKVSGAGCVIAGIAAQDYDSKEATGIISAYTDGLFGLKIASNGSATLGSYVRSAGSDNTITVCTTLDNETGKSIGKSLETATTSETIVVRVNL